jgi:hypothetical protein
MVYEPKKIDVRGDRLVNSFKDAGTSDDGKFARMTFAAPDGTEVPLRMPAELIDKFLPQLMSLAAECERRRNAGTSPKRVHQIKQGAVSLSTDDQIAFDFTLSTGQNYSFLMDRVGASLIYQSLGTILGIAEQKHGPVSIPTKQ